MSSARRSGARCHHLWFDFPGSLGSVNEQSKEKRWDNTEWVAVLGWWRREAAGNWIEIFPFPPGAIPNSNHSNDNSMTFPPSAWLKRAGEKSKLFHLYPKDESRIRVRRNIKKKLVKFENILLLSQLSCRIYCRWRSGLVCWFKWHGAWSMVAEE